MRALGKFLLASRQLQEQNFSHQTLLELLPWARSAGIIGHFVLLEETWRTRVRSRFDPWVPNCAWQGIIEGGDALLVLLPE